MKTQIALVMAGLIAATSAWADPPSHAPAHGYYKDKEKHKHKYKEHKYHGKSGAYYVQDYGIHSGKCNRDEIGAVIGGVGGAVIGGQVAGKDDRVVGMVVGGVLGAVLGHAVGDAMDKKDRACMGHALELGKSGAPVIWNNDRRRYSFTPKGDAPNNCRYAALSIDGGKSRDVLACPNKQGEWKFDRY